MEDGVVYEVLGVKVAGINGIVSLRRRVKGGVPRKSPEEFVSTARRIRGKNVDILLVHQTPYLPELFNMKRDPGGEAALEAISLVRPRIIVNGHMHQGGFKVHRLPWGGLFINIDSSQEHRYYAIIRVSGGKFDVELWKDKVKIHSTTA
jgi:Icc-related predicted phosphoesterase